MARFTFRAWGDLLAAVWAEHDSRDYSYLHFYTDSDVEIFVFGRSSPVRWIADNEELGSLPERTSPPTVVEVGGTRDGATRHIIPGSGKDTWFKDCEHGPEMVLVPAGQFQMGLPEDQLGLVGKSAIPRHRVTIAKPFAVSRYQITFAEWDATVAAGAVSHIPDDGGWGRGRQPVINVSWDDAKAYAAWLSVQTGKLYRLLTEAEWEYVARAGTTTPFWWGSVMPTRLPDYNFDEVSGRGPTSEVRQHTIQVDGLATNPLGLFHVHGDLKEWCEDAGNDNYVGGPADGSAWAGTDPGRRVLRGGWRSRTGERFWVRHFSRDGA